jgi:hypothetical protein
MANALVGRTNALVGMANALVGLANAFVDYTKYCLCEPNKHNCRRKMIILPVIISGGKLIRTIYFAWVFAHISGG